MITKHSIDLRMINEKCFALREDSCKILVKKESACCTWRCPFYKPKECRKWIRIEDRTGIHLVPPEDLGI